MRKFIEENRREVLIIELDMNDGSSTDLRAALQYSGLLEYVFYTQQETNVIEDWPTMGELIYSNKRIILFGTGDGMDSCPASQCLDGRFSSNNQPWEWNVDNGQGFRIENYTSHGPNSLYQE